MKKLNVVLLSSLLLLVACSDENVDGETVQESASTDTEAVEMSEESEATTEEESSTKVDATEESEEPIEEDPAEESEYDDAFELPEGLAHPLEYYMSEDPSLINEYGMTVTDFEGFILGISVFLVDFKPYEEYLYSYEEKENIRALLVLTDGENINDFDVDYNGDMTFTTDTKEQVRGDAGIFSSNDAVMTYYGQVEAAGYYIIPLKDDSEPTKLTAILEGPWKVENGTVFTGDGPMGGEVRIPLVAEE